MWHYKQTTASCNKTSGLMLLFAIFLTAEEQPGNGIISDQVNKYSHEFLVQIESNYFSAETTILLR